MIGYEKSRCCVEKFYCTDSIWSANKVKGKWRQRNISSSWIFDLPCDVKLRTLLRMSNKSNSFESDLLYFQKGPVPYKSWLHLNISRVHANLNIFAVWSKTDILVSINNTVFSCPREVIYGSLPVFPGIMGPCSQTLAWWFWPWHLKHLVVLCNLVQCVVFWDK